MIAKDLTLSSVTLKWIIIKTVSVLTQSLLRDGRDKHNVFFQVLESRITEPMISKEIKITCKKSKFSGNFATLVV